MSEDLTKKRLDLSNDLQFFGENKGRLSSPADNDAAAFSKEVQQLQSQVKSKFKTSLILEDLEHQNYREKAFLSGSILPDAVDEENSADKKRKRDDDSQKSKNSKTNIDLSPLNTPLHLPSMPAAGIVNALNSFMTASADLSLDHHTDDYHKADKNFTVADICKAMVKAVEECVSKEYNMKMGLAGVLNPIMQKKPRQISSNSSGIRKSRIMGEIEIISTGPGDNDKKRKYKYLCPHGKTKYFCKQCGGSMICEHMKQRHYCATCKSDGKSTAKSMKKRKRTGEEEDALNHLDDDKTESERHDDNLSLPNVQVPETLQV